MIRKPKKKKAGAVATAPPEPVVLPDPGAKVGLQVDGRMRRWGARVVTVDGHAVTVRLGGNTPPVVPEPGAAVKIGWPEQTSYRLADATMTAAQAEPEVVWTLEVGPSRRVQRRGAFRLRIARPVVLVVGGRERATETTDVSEGGLGCELDLAFAPEEGARVGVRLSLGLGEEDEEVVVGEAEVVRCVEGSDPGLRSLGVAWVAEDDARAETLRRFVFEAQQAQAARGGV